MLLLELPTSLQGSTPEVLMIYSLSFSGSLPLLVEEVEVVLVDQCTTITTIILIIITRLQLGKWLQSRTSCLAASKISTKEPPRR